MKTLKQLLSTIKDKETAYKLAVDTKHIADQEYKINEERIDQELAQKLEKAKQTYLDICRKSTEEAMAKKKKLAPPQNMNDLLEESANDFNNDYFSILGKLKITNSDLCSLLKKSTGKKWKVFPVNGHSEGGKNIYGLVFVNNDSKLYRNWFGPINIKKITQSASALLIIGLEQNDIVRLGKQDWINETTWGEFYLKKKFDIGVSHNNIASLYYSQYFANLVVNAIDQHIESMEQEDEK